MAPFGSIVTTASTPRTASRASVNAAQPFSFAAESAVSERSNALTECPALTRFAAIPPPMLPRPMNSIFMVRSPSTHRRNDESVGIVADAAVGPALGDGLDLGPELETLGAVLVGVAECAALPSTERVIGDGHRDRHVDADHAYVDAAGKLARGVAVAGEDCDAVAVLMLARQTHRLFEILRPDDLQHGAEDFFLVAFHVGRHAVEQRGADVEALFMPLESEAAPIDDDFGAFVLGGVDPRFDPRLVLGRDDGTVVRFLVGRDADA